jgi:hypothetical protein
MVDEDHAMSRRAVVLGSLIGGAAIAAPGILAETAQAVPAAPAHRRPGNATGLRGLGIVYDTGFYSGGPNVRSTFEPFDLKVVKKDMKAIAHDLNANAVRVVGGNADRLEAAAKVAAKEGLQVWYSPFTCDLTQAQQSDFLADSAARAERLRGNGHDVVFVAGAETSLFTIGFIPGATIFDRLDFITERGPDFIPAIVQIPAKMNAFFAHTIPRVRHAFRGTITYAAIEGLERIDWTPFDMISADTYRTAEFEAAFPTLMADFVARGAAVGKPVVITESGCSTYYGAAALGGTADSIVEYDNAQNLALRLSQEVVRDEAEQAQCIEELFTVYDQAGVHTAFVQVFAMRHLPYRPHAVATQDLDRASYGIVRPLERGRGWRGHDWEPKQSFFRVAEMYRRFARH